MADQTVKIANLASDKHRVAYEMATEMWLNSKEGFGPKLSEVDEFLKLVSQCMNALNTYSANIAR